MATLRRRIETDEDAGMAWADTCAMADKFLDEEPGPLQPTPIADYYHNEQATINNNLASRFWCGWTACAWKAAIAGDAPALERSVHCLDLVVRTHRDKRGIQIVPESDSDPKRFYYLSSRSFYPEQMIVLVELMRSEGFSDNGLLRELIERLLFLTESAASACEQLHQERAPYWNGDNCHGACLLSIGAILPNHPDAPEWETLGWRNMAEYFGEQSVLPDGTFHEAFPWAEGYGLEFLYPVLAILRGSQEIDIPNLKLSPTRLLRNAIQWQIDVASPLGEIPSINDTNSHESFMGGYHSLPILGQWAGMPEVWSALRTERYRLPVYAYAHRPDAPVVKHSESLLLSDVGWSIMRSGKGPEAFYAMFDHGIHQSGHCMPQCLTFDMVRHGHHWIVNSGCAPHYCTYDEQNSWHRTTKAGNCIEIDGEEIPDRTDGELLEWNQNHKCITITARHQGYAAVVHTRQLIHQNEGPIVVIDHLMPNDGKSHSAKSYWHINGELIRRTQNCFAFVASGDRYLSVLHQSLSPEVEVAEGPCGGLGRLNLAPGKLPSRQPISPGDPGWRMVPYLVIESIVPPSGKFEISAFIPEQEDRGNWTLKITDGSLTLSRCGHSVLEAAFSR